MQRVNCRCFYTQSHLTGRKEGLDVFRPTESKYINNCSFLKQYSWNKYKLVTLKSSIKASGYEEEKNPLYDAEGKYSRDKNEEKLDNSISRTKSKIYEYALCNDFEYFVTLTLDSKKIDRSDVNNYIKKLGQYIRDIRKSTGQKIEYILIPEKHADDLNWHMHGLMKGLQDLREYNESENIPRRMKDKIKKYREENLNLFEWVGYSEKFGFNCVEPIRNKDACSRYITKYISKNIDNDKGITEKNKKKYYASRGLKTSKNIKKGVIPTENIIYDFENEYCKIKWLDMNQADEIEKLFLKTL